MFFGTKMENLSDYKNNNSSNPDRYQRNDRYLINTHIFILRRLITSKSSHDSGIYLDSFTEL